MPSSDFLEALKYYIPSLAPSFSTPFTSTTTTQTGVTLSLTSGANSLLMFLLTTVLFFVIIVVSDSVKKMRK